MPMFGKNNSFKSSEIYNSLHGLQIEDAAIRAAAGEPSQELSPHVGAVKHDSGKLPMELIPTSLLNGLAEVLAFGARKYQRENWRKGMDWSRLIGAALRHISAWNDGTDIDPESNLSHLKHAACCIAFLIEYEERKLGKDDRFKRTK